MAGKCRTVGSSYGGDETDVDCGRVSNVMILYIISLTQTEVALANSELELSHGFDERHGLDVSDGTCWMSIRHRRCMMIWRLTSEFYDADVWCLFGAVHRYVCHSLDPVLDGITDVWDDLGRYQYV